MSELDSTEFDNVQWESPSLVRCVKLHLKTPRTFLGLTIVAAVAEISDEELRALLRRAYETERKTRQLIEKTEELLRQSRALERGEILPRIDATAGLALAGVSHT